MHQAYMSAFKGDIPYNVALIKLEEGPFMYSNVIDDKWENLRRGTPVEVVFEDASPGTALRMVKYLPSTGRPAPPGARIPQLRR